MKISYFSLLVLGFASLVLSGCVTETERVPLAQTDQTTKRVHTQEELRKTGHSETAAALEKVDPSVRTSGR